MSEPDAKLVREVSRSFSISLRLLPGPMRGPVSLAYLLARASDTLADTAAVPVAERIARLEGFGAEIDGGPAVWRDQMAGFIERQEHPGERRLMARLNECFEAFERLPEQSREIVREVIRTIVGGQRLDLERFGRQPAVMPDDAALVDYCWRVAGCVGVFWTRVGFETLGGRFATAAPEILERQGAAYGQGLQLVNILRDLPADLANGRCYLPVADPEDRAALLHAAAGWRAIAREWLAEGERYAAVLQGRRLRAASVLPARLGEKTLDLLDAADWQALESGVKIDRRTVRREMLRAFLPSARGEPSGGRGAGHSDK